MDGFPEEAEDMDKLEKRLGQKHTHRRTQRERMCVSVVWQTHVFTDRAAHKRADRQGQG